jgi:hypothetical protein
MSTVMELERLATITVAGFISAVAEVTEPPAAKGFTVTGPDGSRMDAPPPSAAILTAAKVALPHGIMANVIMARTLEIRRCLFRTGLLIGFGQQNSDVSGDNSLCQKEGLQMLRPFSWVGRPVEL